MILYKLLLSDSPEDVKVAFTTINWKDGAEVLEFLYACNLRLRELHETNGNEELKDCFEQSADAEYNKLIDKYELSSIDYEIYRTISFLYHDIWS